MTDQDKQDIVMMVADRLALALAGTASRFRDCDPRTPNVLESVAEYLKAPAKAEERIAQEKESLRRLNQVP